MVQFSPQGGNGTVFAPSDVLARLPGLEPGASGLGGSRSIQLSYRRIWFSARCPARRDILSPAARCCQEVFPIAAACLFRQKTLQSPAACGMLGLRGWISRKIE